MNLGEVGESRARMQRGDIRSRNGEPTAPAFGEKRHRIRAVIALVASAGMANLSAASPATVTGTLGTNSLTPPGGGGISPRRARTFLGLRRCAEAPRIWREVQSTRSREDPHGRRRSQRSAPRVQGELNQVNRRL